MMNGAASRDEWREQFARRVTATVVWLVVTIVGVLATALAVRLALWIVGGAW